MECVDVDKLILAAHVDTHCVSESEATAGGTQAQKPLPLHENTN